MTGLTFTIIPPYTETPSSFTISPSHYKITSTFLGHQRLEFEQFKKSPRIQRRSRVAVIGQDATKPNFLGWVATYSQPNPAKNQPQRYICYGDSKDLEWRYPWLKDYAAGQNLNTIFSDTPGSQGLLFQASSLIPDAWSLLDAGFSLYMWGGGGFTSTRFVNPTIYMGTTLCTGRDPWTDPYTLGVNEWCQDDVNLYVRTAGAAPYTYPGYAVNFKKAYLKRYPLSSGGTLGDPIYQAKRRYTAFSRE